MILQTAVVMSNKILSLQIAVLILLFVECIQTADKPPGEDEELCGILHDIGKNDLTPIDVVVKNPETNVACIKARFSLAIKVESVIPDLPGEQDDKQGAATNMTSETRKPEDLRMVLGYLPLDHVINVEDSCPDWSQPKPEPQVPETNPGEEAGEKPEAGGDENHTKEDGTKQEDKKEEPEDLEMIVTFQCGKLAFTFKRNETCDYLYSIKGLVKLDSRVVREFIAERPMLITSDLNHHFKFDDLIEVGSKATNKAYILSANLYFTEIETYRNTTSRDFIRPPDESSKPFQDEPPE